MRNFIKEGGFDYIIDNFKKLKVEEFGAIKDQLVGQKNQVT